MAELTPKKVDFEKLNAKDKVFAQEYLIDLNAYQAAIRAGYAPTTARNASAWIGENATKPKLAAYVAYQMAERARRTGVSADRVLEELAKIAFANHSDIVDPETGKLLKNVRRDDMAAVESVCVRRGKNSSVEVRLHPKHKALELLGKHLGLFGDNAAAPDEIPTIIDDLGGGAGA